MSLSHTYNPVTKDYVSTSDDFGYVPANATRTALPPRPWTRQWPRWTDNAWELVEDHRERKPPAFLPEDTQEATKFWLPGDTHDTAPSQLFIPGPLPDGALLERPAKPAELILAEAKEAKTSEIEKGYQDAIAAITTMPQASPTASDVAVGAVLLAEEDPQGFAWLIGQFADTRAGLMAEVASAETVEEAGSIVVSYAV